MSRTRVCFRCQLCGAESPKWLGRCQECGEWGSVIEEHSPSSNGSGSGRAEAVQAAIPMLEVSSEGEEPMPSGVGELDRVLGGGLVPGSVTLLGGEPGIGKSTLVLQALAGLVAERPGERAMVVTAEESRQQVRARAERLGVLSADLWLLAETSLASIATQIRQVRPAVVAVDSVQTIHDPAFESAPGTVSQVRECTHRLVQLAKQEGVAVILVGHVTKEGSLAGPRTLEHLVDTVLSFEGDRHHALRMLRAVKHRFGPTSELGLFEMTGSGLRDLSDPSALFLADRRQGTSGSAVAAVLEGARPLLVEVQALTGRDRTQMPRRAATGVDPARLAMLLGVLDRRADVSLASVDVYASVAGGVRLAEPGGDLALCLALVSAHRNVSLPPDSVAVGEVGLGGEIRQAAQTPRRLAEAARLGFTEAIVPESTPDVSGIRLRRVTTLTQAIRQVLGP